ncbi:ferredoxin [Nocardia sp. ET3-3]|uniref:Ferredoxin n=1 Tax=Nocardia terrae TaxID=2675851 RepID=A0A7K1USD4_9NOCA|nr:ferredoxin [Nocardia terrae]MVU77262.1 ferredoxin [Nocardia terrae]
MRISVNRSRCEGHGLCTQQAPAVFSLDDNTELNQRFEDTDIPAEYLPAARAAIGACPVAALRERH